MPTLNIVPHNAFVDKIQSLIEEVESFKVSSKEGVEAFRLKYLSKKGIIPALFGEMKNIAPDERKQYGQEVNELKNRAEEKLQQLRAAFESTEEKKIKIDYLE